LFKFFKGSDYDVSVASRFDCFLPSLLHVGLSSSDGLEFDCDQASVAQVHHIRNARHDAHGLIDDCTDLVVAVVVYRE